MIRYGSINYYAHNKKRAHLTLIEHIVYIYLYISAVVCLSLSHLQAAPPPSIPKKRLGYIISVRFPNTIEGSTLTLHPAITRWSEISYNKKKLQISSIAGVLCIKHNRVLWGKSWWSTYRASKTLSPVYPLWGLSLLKCLRQFFLLDSRYSGQLFTNFRGILRGIGCTIAGDEKLLHFTGRSPDVRVVYMKPDRVGLWIYELCVKLSNDLPYMLDLWLHDSIGNIGETNPVSDVVANHSFV